eukprot:CAMPEP_0174277690 /NCGR_PEP_ID=MMETSP0439-20130205/61068_1 /TAXON_ID=0 /ORGANISM="Stereomyxa ramosa, Strain Chinc5" /LENGTH=108 /DNA_ID=CAMNT_0015370031 /DNA_START=1162 /DNA_END=1488 /DNA_ORIENTATION=+
MQLQRAVGVILYVFITKKPNEEASAQAQQESYNKLYEAKKHKGPKGDDGGGVDGGGDLSEEESGEAKVLDYSADCLHHFHVHVLAFCKYHPKCCQRYYLKNHLESLQS